jgi:HSP20 family protein
MNRLFNESDFRPSLWNEDVAMTSWHPVVDIYDEDNKIVIKAELPGMDKKDISIDLKDRVLTLKGERSSENEVKEDKFYRRERSFGKFERSFTMPLGLDPEKIKADYNHGVLKIEVNKPEKEKPKQITIH